MGLVRSLIDPCLLSNLDKSFYLGVYVDDIFVIGNDEDINKMYEDLERKFTLKIEKKTTEFLGCNIDINHEK